MYWSIEEAESRLFRMGSLTAIIGAVHIFSLILNWYVYTSDSIQSIAIQGYMINEVLFLSVFGGVLAGLAALSTFLTKKLSQMKNVEAFCAFVGGIIALISPIYMIFIKIPKLGTGYYDVGLFVSIISAISLLISGIIISFIPTRFEVIPAPAPSTTLPTGIPSPTPQTLTQVPRQTTVMIPTDDFPIGAMCTICLQPLEVGSTAKCKACGALFHQGCIDAWVELNRVCPNCNTPVEYYSIE